jgi:MYXO-CTERM domain-containing protein
MTEAVDTAMPTGTDAVVTSDSDSGSSGDDGGCSLTPGGKPTSHRWLVLTLLGLGMGLSRRRR